jgi:hypothetical protein
VLVGSIRGQGLVIGIWGGLAVLWDLRQTPGTWCQNWDELYRLLSCCLENWRFSRNLLQVWGRRTHLVSDVLNENQLSMAHTRCLVPICTFIIYLFKLYVDHELNIRDCYILVTSDKLKIGDLKCNSVYFRLVINRIGRKSNFCMFLINFCTKT